MSSEKQVQMAAQMYESRRMAKQILGDGYFGHMAKIAVILNAQAVKLNCSPLEAVIRLGRTLPEIDTLMMVAAIVEMTEPST